MFKARMRLIAAASLVSLASIGGALADTAPAQVTVTGTQVAAPGSVGAAIFDFSPIVVVLEQLAAGALLLVGTLALRKLDAFLANKARAAGIEITAAEQAAFDAKITKGFAFALERVADVTAAKISSGSLSVDLKSKMAAETASYLSSHFPDALETRGLMRPDGSVDLEAVARLVDSRLGLMQVTTVAPAIAAQAVVQAPVVAVAGAVP